MGGGGRWRGGEVEGCVPPFFTLTVFSQVASKLHTRPDPCIR